MVICFTHSFPNKVSNKGDFWFEHLTWKTGNFLCRRSTTRYGEKQQRFEHLAFLNFAQNVVCFLSSLLSMLLNYPSSLLLWFPFASLLMLAIDAESMHREWVQRKTRNYLTCNGFRVGHDYQMFLGFVCVLCVWNYWLIGWPNSKQCCTYGQTWRRKHKLQL